MLFFSLHMAAHAFTIVGVIFLLRREFKNRGRHRVGDPINQGNEE